MLYYILNETLQTLKSKYARYYLLGLLAVSILANLAMIGFRDMIYGTNDGTYGYNIIMFAGGFFWVPYYSCIFIADMVFGKDYPDPHLRDRTTVGLKRHHIFFGKLISDYILLAIYSVAAFLIFITVSVVFQLSAGAIEMEIIKEFAFNLLVAFPLFMAGVTIGNMFLFMFRKKVRAFTAYIITVVIIPRIIMFFGAAPFSVAFLRSIKDKVLLTPQFTALQFYATRDIPKILVSSAIYIAAACTIGCICYSKKVFES